MPGEKGNERKEKRKEIEFEIGILQIFLFTFELEAIGHAGLGSIELKAFELKMSLSFEKSSKS